MFNHFLSFVGLALSACCIPIASFAEEAATHDVDPLFVIRSGRLAPLPASSVDVKAQGWSSLFTGEEWLVFVAPMEDVENFIRTSPSLLGVEPVRLPADGSIRNQWDPNRPGWYTTDQVTRGLRYEIPDDNGHNYGEVVVDEGGSNVQEVRVFVWVEWS